MQIGGLDASFPSIEFDTYGSYGTFRNRCGAGTQASPTAITTGTECGTLRSFLYNGASFVGPLTYISTFAAENQSSGHGGTNVKIGTTPIAATTAIDALTIGSDQNITVAGQAGSGTRCVHVDSTGKQSPTSADCPTSGAGTTFTGAVTGTTPTYAGAASGFVATAGFQFCSAGLWPAANGANPTLNVNSTGAKPIKLGTQAGLSSMVNSEIPLAIPVCFILDASATNWVMTTSAASPAAIALTDTVTAVKWIGQPYYHPPCRFDESTGRRYLHTDGWRNCPALH